MMSQTSRYALHVLGYLAARPDQRIRGEQIAAATGVPANYLSKILNQLRKGGLVDSQKGWGGGFVLQPGAEKRPIVEVIEIIDGQGAGHRLDCAFGRPQCDDNNPCPMHDRWAELRAGYTSMLTETRVCDLVDR